MQKRIAKDRVPTVFLAMELSAPIRMFLKTCNNSPYLGLEKSGNNTRAYFSAQPDGVEIPGAMWELSSFLRETTGN